jgi:hypothetical protein
LIVAAGEGKAVQWLRDHVNHPDKEQCLIWPFSLTRGYGKFGYFGKPHYAHTFMCELANGPAPSDIHQPAHSCGVSRCCNPHHISWKTPSANQLDKIAHGTAHQVHGRRRSKLSACDIEEIRKLGGQKTHDEIAATFNVSRRTIGAVLDGRTWGADRRHFVFQPEDDAQLRELNDKGLSLTAIAKLMSRNLQSVTRRAKVMGLKINFPKPERTKPVRVFTPEEVLAIRKLRGKLSADKTAVMYQAHHGQIERIMTRRSYAWVPDEGAGT